MGRAAALPIARGLHPAQPLQAALFSRPWPLHTAGVRQEISLAARIVAVADVYEDACLNYCVGQDKNCQTNCRPNGSFVASQLVFDLGVDIVALPSEGRPDLERPNVLTGRRMTTALGLDLVPVSWTTEHIAFTPVSAESPQ